MRQLVGQADPYATAKEASNRLALALLPAWRKRILASENPRSATLKLAIAANIIDFGIKGDLKAEDIPAALEGSFASPLEGDVEAFFEAVDRAHDVLFLADNAGELVFDRLLLELLPREKITVVVKGQPAINDALLADAEAAGLRGRVTVMDNGSGAAGTLLESCSLEFQRRFASADLIIAKGQANFEALEGCDNDIFFLLKIKCPIVARHIGHAVGSLVLHRNVPAAAANRGAARPRIEARARNQTTKINTQRKDTVMTPMGDGTGPLGQGPGKGKGLGPCGGGQRRGWGGGRGQGGGRGRRRGQGRGFGQGRGPGQNPGSDPNANPPNPADENKPNS